LKVPYYFKSRDSGFPARETQAPYQKLFGAGGYFSGTYSGKLLSEFFHGWRNDELGGPTLFLL